MRRYWSLRVVASVAVVAAISLALVAPAGAAKTKQPKLTGSITVSAAASLTDVFTQMGKDFQKANKGTAVAFNFASSSALVLQIQQGAPADVFASADGTNMQKLVSGGQVTADPADFTANLLTIVVKKGNPKNVRSLADLAKVGTISLCADTVPCGKYAAQALTNAGVTIPAGKVTKGADVKATLTAVSAGDADAAMVYQTDVLSAGPGVQAVKIPASLNVLAVYPIARVAKTSNPKLARAWVDYTLSAAGQKTLAKYGFLPVPAT
jgi:molybdate transport system substrate-binding protein